MEKGICLARVGGAELTHACTRAVTHVHIDCASVLTERPPRNENGQLTVFE